MCFALPSDRNRLHQQARHQQHSAVATAVRLVLTCPKLRCLTLRYLVLGLLLLRTSFKWIYTSRQPPNRLMQPINGSSFAVVLAPADDALRLPSSFLTSFCLNKIYLLPNLLPDFENLLIRLLLYSLVYHQARPILTSTVFYAKLSALASQASGSLELAADPLADASSSAPGRTLAGASPDPPSNVPSNVQSRLPFISFLLSSSALLRSYFLRQFFLSTLIPLGRFFKIHFGPKELKELHRPASGSSQNQNRNLKFTSLFFFFKFFYFSLLNGSSYKLPNFRLFLNKLSSKSSVPALVSAITANALFRPANENKIRFRPFGRPFKSSYWAILLILLNFNVLCEGAVRKATLYTAGFFPLSGEKADLGLGILPAVQLALDDITENDVIPGFKLDLVGNDTMVSKRLSLYDFVLSAVRCRSRIFWLAVYYPLSSPILLHNSKQ